MPRAFQANKPERSCTLQLSAVNEMNKLTGEGGAPEGGEDKGKRGGLTISPLEWGCSWPSPAIGQSGGTTLWLLCSSSTHAVWPEYRQPRPKDAGSSAPICSFTALRSALLEMKQPLALERVS